MKKVIKFLGSLIVVLVALLALGVMLSDVEPKEWTPAPNPGLTGDYAPNDKLKTAHYTRIDGSGPEDIAVRGDGLIFTGLEDGRIIMISQDGEVTTFVNTMGRPLGMQFAASGNLIVADGIKGLIKISPSGDIATLVTHYRGEKLELIDDLDIAADGSIWFSNVSQRRGLGSFTSEFIEMNPTGALFKYDPKTEVVTEEIPNLYFANGVALGPDDVFVLVNETSTGRVYRKWLKGESAGDIDLFHSGLPGGGDNLSFNGVDRFWIAVPSLRLPIVEDLYDKLLIRKIISALPDWLITPSSVYSHIVALDVEGNVLETYQDTDAEYQMITSVNQKGSSLYIGSLTETRIAIVDTTTMPTQRN